VIVVQPSFECSVNGEKLSPAVGEYLMWWIERCARISHKSEGAQTEDSWRRFIDAVVISHGDWSVVEHAFATVVFRVDRGVTHELVRHRMFSFTQESTRFVNGQKSYPDGLEFIMPAVVAEKTDMMRWTWTQAMNDAERSYLQLLKDGARPQEARSVLPNSLAATIAMTGNLRSWRHFLLMRTTKESHPDMRAITIPLLIEFKKCVPILFDDIAPHARQIDNMGKPR
jgi:thymidylate synthase (FAD)